MKGQKAIKVPDPGRALYAFIIYDHMMASRIDGKACLNSRPYLKMIARQKDTGFGWKI
jgi:hypothetical protein